MKRIEPPADIRALLPVEQIESRFELQQRIIRRNETILALMLYSLGMTLAFIALCALS